MYIRLAYSAHTPIEHCSCVVRAFNHKVRRTSNDDSLDFLDCSRGSIGLFRGWDVVADVVEGNARGVSKLFQVGTR
jgi:hypothetical protein